MNPPVNRSTDEPEHQHLSTEAPEQPENPFFQSYGFSSAVQLTTTVIGVVAAPVDRASAGIWGSRFRRTLT